MSALSVPVNFNSYMCKLIWRLNFTFWRENLSKIVSSSSLWASERHPLRGHRYFFSAFPHIFDLVSIDSHLFSYFYHLSYVFPFPKPSMPSNSLSPLQLDIACIRHLVSRHHLAQVIFPSNDTLGRLQRALRLLHGSGHHTHFIALQVLHTTLSTISDSLQSFHSANKLDARTILEMVDLTLGLDLETEIFTIQLQETLLTICIHAALGWLPHIPKGDWQSTYRYLLKLLRNKTWASEMNDLRADGVKRVKAILISMHRLADNEPETMRDRLCEIVTQFNEDHPLKRLHSMLLSHVKQIAEMLPHLSFREHEKTRVQQHVRDEVAESDLPEFFSDAEGEVETEGRRIKAEREDARFSPVGSDSEHEGQNQSANDGEMEEERNKRRSRRRRSRRSLRGSAAKDAQRNDRKRAVLRKREPINYHEMSESDDGDDKSNALNREPNENGEVKGRELRPRKPQRNQYQEESDDTFSDQASQEIDEDCMRELDNVGSDAFSSDTPSEDDVARNSNSRALERKKRRVANPKTVSSRKEILEPNGDELEVESENEKIDSDREGEELGEVDGPDGETLRDLKKAALNLNKSARLSDPLPKAIADARHAQSCKRKPHVDMFAVCENARAVSPIPESETPLRRKKRSRATLSSGSDSEFPEKRFREKEQRYFGKILRSGRFRMFEDELLIEGLEKYGWGAWTDIARDFGKSQYTRGPMSLKDRARTLVLDPAEYPPPRMKRGRPNQRVLTRNEPGNDEDGDEIEQPSSAYSEAEE